MNRLVVHYALIRLARDVEEESLDPDPFSRENEYQMWHATQAPTIFRDTTPNKLGLELLAKEESFNNPPEGYLCRTFDQTRSYPLGAHHENEIEQFTFKVELITSSVHSFFWHFVFYAGRESWLGKDDPRVVTTYGD